MLDWVSINRYRGSICSPEFGGHCDKIAPKRPAVRWHGWLQKYIGFGKPQKRFWFSPNLRFPLNAVKEGKESALSEQNIMSLEGLITSVMKEVGYDWSDVQKSIVNPEVPS